MSNPGTFLERYVEDYQLLSPMDEYPKTKSTKLFRMMAKQLAGSGPLISSFDDWHENIFVSQKNIKILIMLKEFQDPLLIFFRLYQKNLRLF